MKKNNPWNIKLEVNFNKEHKRIILQWYEKISKCKLFKEEKENFLKNNPLNDKSKKYLEDFYNEGYGFKVIAKCLDLTYTKTRNLLINYLKIKTRKGRNVCTEKTKQFRSERVKGKKNPWFDWPTKNPFQVTHSETGIQGYYLKKEDNQYVWLRSCWEYIFVKWLDKNNIKWEIVRKSYKIMNGKETYLPDFIIYQDCDKFFVEVKGTRYKNRLYKVDEFRKSYPNCKIIIIDDIKPFISKETNYKKELEKWKNIKLKKEELPK